MKDFKMACEIRIVGFASLPPARRMALLTWLEAQAMWVRKNQETLALNYAARYLVPKEA